MPQRVAARRSPGVAGLFQGHRGGSACLLARGGIGGAFRQSSECRQGGGVGPTGERRDRGGGKFRVRASGDASGAGYALLAAEARQGAEQALGGLGWCGFDRREKRLGPGRGVGAALGDRNDRAEGASALGVVRGGDRPGNDRGLGRVGADLGERGEGGVADRGLGGFARAEQQRDPFGEIACGDGLQGRRPGRGFASFRGRENRLRDPGAPHAREAAAGGFGGVLGSGSDAEQ